MLTTLSSIMHTNKSMMLCWSLYTWLVYKIMLDNVTDTWKEYYKVENPKIFLLICNTISLFCIFEYVTFLFLSNRKQP